MNPLIEALGQPWAIEESVLRAIHQNLLRPGGEAQVMPQGQAEGSAPEAMDGLRAAPAGGDWIIPIQGIIVPHASMLRSWFAPRGTGIDTIRAAIDEAAANDAGRIVFTVTSPGGLVSGVPELAADIAALKIPTVAYTENQMASAAYWLMAGCDEIYASRSAQVGSVGVYAVMEDTSKAAEDRGYKVILVKSGDLKGAGVWGTEITDDQVSAVADHVNTYGEMFRDVVAAGRQLSPEQMARVATGAVWLAGKAYELGAIDGVLTRREFTAKLAEKHKSGGHRAMEKNTKTEATSETTTGAQASTPAPSAGPAQPEASSTPDPVAAERSRVSGLMGLKAKYDTHAKLIDRCISDGTSVEEATHKVIEAEQAMRAGMALQREASAVDEGAALGTTNSDVPASAADLTHEALKARWETDRDARAAHRSFEWFCIYERAAAKRAA